MQQAPRLCISCHAPLQPGAGYCGYCGTHQSARQVEERPAAPAYPAYSEGFQPPTGQGQAFQPPAGLAATAIQPMQPQPVYYVQPVIVPLPMKQRTISGLALSSLILGVVGIFLAFLHLILDAEFGTASYMSFAQLLFILLLALFPWTPALMALIFGHMARDKIRRDGGQTGGLGLSYAGTALGAVALGLPIVGFLFVLLTLLP